MYKDTYIYLENNNIYSFVYIKKKDIYKTDRITSSFYI